LVPWAESGMRTFVRFLAPRGVIGADHQDAGQLAWAPAAGWSDHGVHARDLCSHSRQVVQQLQRTLARRLRRQPMQAPKPATRAMSC